MCGIVGFFEKSGADSTRRAADAGFRMLSELGHRGPDSVGMAIYGDSTPGRYMVRVNLGADGRADDLVAQAGKALAACGTIENFTRSGGWVTFDLPDTTEISAVTRAIDSWGSDLELASIGRRLSISKQVGTPSQFEEEFHVSDVASTHILGHTRLSTESRVDLCHSQPFWGHIYPDLAIVHNGHVTNYHKLRRQYEQRGIKFYTENDSEIIAVYLGERLKSGDSLEGALDGMLHDLDGSYSCLASTDTEFGYVRDRFAFKPLAIAENDQCVAIATEEVAIRAVIANEFEVREVNAKEVRVWQQ